jgi:glycosyltransferase involved in cell wall biosynthesis
MKICLINNIYPPYHRGGAEQVVMKTVRGLRDAGHRVILITAAPSGDYVEHHGDSLTIYRFRPRNVFFYTDAHTHSLLTRTIWHCIDMFNTSVARKIRAILEREKPDVVHTHNLMGLSFLAPRVIRSLGIPHVHTVHDVQLVEPSGIILKAREHHWRYSGWPTRVYTWVMKQLMGSPHVVISPSQFLLTFYTSRGFFSSSQRIVVRNPATFAEPKQRGLRGAAQETTFLYVGQIEPHKGVTLLIDAFTRIPSGQLFGATLHIVGSGSALSDIKKRASDDARIVVHGRLTRDQLPSLFSKTDVTVVPSLCYENSPTVIFESLLFGVPVLASHIEGIAELIDEGKNGMTFTAGDADALTEKLMWCSQYRDRLRSMSSQARASLRGMSQTAYIHSLTRVYSLVSNKEDVTQVSAHT